MSPAVTPGINNLPAGRLKRVLKHIEANLQGELNVSGLANVASLSPYHFARAFNRAMGVPPMRYVWRRRVVYARELIAHGPDQSLGEVAYKCGFKNNSHFTEAFKRETGMTPSAFRKTIGGSLLCFFQEWGVSLEVVLTT